MGAKREKPLSGAPFPWHEREAGDVLSHLGTDPDRGLTEGESRRRLGLAGPNVIVEGPGRTIPRILRDQVSSVLILLLLAAALFSAFLGEVVEASAILAVVLLFVVLGVVQEYRSEKAIAALKALARPQARVLRGGRLREVPSRDLVAGDILVLEAGRVVPADARVVSGADLRIREDTLTGESEASGKESGALCGADLPLGDRRNMAYMGTYAVHGRGTAVVVATGMDTELGKIAAMVEAVRPEPTPLQRRLSGLGRTLAAAAVGIALLLVGIGAARGENLTLMLLTGVSLAVAIVPEGLPAVLTFSLALGAKRMLRRKVLVRTLPAVEALGSVTVICADKTGTLTQNRMAVAVLLTPGGRHDLPCGPEGDVEGRTLSPGNPALSVLLLCGALCNDASPGGAPTDPGDAPPSAGDPTEVALVRAAGGAGLRKREADGRFPRVAEIPFDPRRRRMTTVHAIREEERGGAPALDAWGGLLKALCGGAPFVAVTKGAVDDLLPTCSEAYVDGRRQLLTDALRARIAADADRLGGEGARVLGVAFRPLAVLAEPVRPDDLDADLVFLGCFGIVDPPRPEAKAAVGTCRAAGIRPVMITGDHPRTARAVAEALGIARPGDGILTGRELAAMSVAELARAAGDVSVYARVAPEHKLKIVEALQARGHVVAMTGDGVNDAPALRKADIGVAMGSGTDVAKAAAGMILLDDNFASIVAAVEEGRVVYDNVRRFVEFSLSGNIGKTAVVVVPPLLGMPLLLTPVQILWANFLTDGLLGLGLGTEKAEPDGMRRPPVPPTEGVLGGGFGFRASWVGALFGILVIGLAALLWREGHPRTGVIVFTAISSLQAGKALSSRSFRRPALFIDPRGNPLLLVMVVLALLLQLAVLYVPAVRPYFRTAALSAPEFLACVALGAFVFLVVEAEKLIRSRNRGKTG